MASADRPETGGRPRVLFVDDEPAILQGLRYALRRESFEVVTAATPQEAMRILMESKVDVIVADECMPAMSGSEFLRVARALTPDTPRIVLTGNTERSQAMTPIHGGDIFRLLSKPCDADVLAAAIHQALALRGR